MVKTYCRLTQPFSADASTAATFGFGFGYLFSAPFSALIAGFIRFCRMSKEYFGTDVWDFTDTALNNTATHPEGIIRGGPV